MVENKTTLQVNKYADRFLMAEVKNILREPPTKHTPTWPAEPCA